MDSNALLEQYQNYFGNILFPNTPGRRAVEQNPANWMYSYDGFTWKQVPMDIGKIDYNHALYRPKPTNYEIGVTASVKQHPEKYEYSHDNGHTWSSLCVDDNPSGHTWIYHGSHDTTWFRPYTKPYTSDNTSQQLIINNTEANQKDNLKDIAGSWRLIMLLMIICLALTKERIFQLCYIATILFTFSMMIRYLWKAQSFQNRIYPSLKQITEDMFQIRIMECPAETILLKPVLPNELRHAPSPKLKLKYYDGNDCLHNGAILLTPDSITVYDEMMTPLPAIPESERRFSL